MELIIKTIRTFVTHFYSHFSVECPSCHKGRGNKTMECSDDNTMNLQCPMELLNNNNNNNNNRKKKKKKIITHNRRHKINFTQLLLASVSLTFLVTVGVAVDVVLLSSKPQQDRESSVAIEEKHNNMNRTLEVNVNPPNGSLCSYFRQWTLSDNVKLTVCNYLGSVRVDIRAFISEKATIKGIWLTISEWEELTKLFKLIQRSLNQANYETRWP